MGKTVIEFENVTKQYKLYKIDKQRFLSIFSKKVPYKEKKAADHLNLRSKKASLWPFLEKTARENLRC